MITDDKIQRWADLVSGKSEPVNYMEKLLVESFSVFYDKNSDLPGFSEKVYLETMLDTPAGMIAMGMLMADLKYRNEKQIMDSAFENDGDPSKIH